MKHLHKRIWLLALFSMLLCFSFPVSAQAKNVKSIRLSSASLTMKGEEKKTLKVKSVKPSGASKKVSWKSSDKKIVSVSKKGVLTAKKKGTATITTKAVKGGKTAKCKVKVVANKKSNVSFFPLSKGKNGTPAPSGQE